MVVVGGVGGVGVLGFGLGILIVVDMGGGQQNGSRSGGGGGLIDVPNMGSSSGDKG